MGGGILFEIQLIQLFVYLTKEKELKVKKVNNYSFMLFYLIHIPFQFFLDTTNRELSMKALNQWQLLSSGHRASIFICLWSPRHVLSPSISQGSRMLRSLWFISYSIYKFIFIEIKITYFHINFFFIYKLNMIYTSIFKWIFIEIKITSYHCSFFFKAYIWIYSKLFSIICKVKCLGMNSGNCNLWYFFDRSKILYV